MKYYILFNPLAGNNTCEKKMESLVIDKDSDTVYYDVTHDGGYNQLLAELKSEDKIVLCGGDGTLNSFVNGIEGFEIKNDILYFAAGSGNDFLHDLDIKDTVNSIVINEHIANLPVVTVKGRNYRFLNGIGIGIDGYVCAEGNRIRKLKGKKVDYTSIALKALMWQYTPVNAKVTVDGKTKEYKRVWMVPTMKGRYFGGGMMIAPNQDRFSPNNEITSIVAHDLSRFRILTIFPLIFKGTHTKYTQYLDIIKCHEVKVEFDRPVDLQIDGETISDVTEYTVTAKKTANAAN